MTRGRFITLEGIDGAGKSTHVAWITERIAASGHEVITTREPGGTPLSEQLREILLRKGMHADTEVLLMFAARAEHVRTVIVPALTAGKWVLSDRFTDATYAYQCGGRGIDVARIAQLEAWVHGDLQPDATFLFDAPLDLARARVAQGTPDPDKFEREQAAFFARVRDAYLARATASNGRIRIIDSSQPIANIRDALAAQLADLLK
jgi:dTMP kinase